MTKILFRNISFGLVALFFFSAFVSCSKTSTIINKSKSELLTQAGWKLTKAELRTGTGGAWVDQTGTLAACDLDDLAFFFINGNYEQNEGATKCSPTDPQIIETGTWVFVSNETQLQTTATGGGSAQNAVIDQLDESSFVFTSSSVIGGTTYYYRSTMKH